MYDFLKIKNQLKFSSWLSFFPYSVPEYLQGESSLDFFPEQWQISSANSSANSSSANLVVVGSDDGTKKPMKFFIGFCVVAVVYPSFIFLGLPLL